MQTKATSHAVYNIWNHLVWCTKYRQPVMVNAIEVEVKTTIGQICATQEWEIGGLEVMPDHIHLFVSTPPTIAPTEIVGRIKSITAIVAFKMFPNLKRRKFWSSGMWSKGYYVGTAGSVSADIIKKYIENQKHI